MRAFLAFVILAALATPAVAKCDPAYAPYYHHRENGPGALLADIFLFPGALAIGLATAPAHVARPKRGDTYGGAELSHHPLCMAGQLARHFVTNRPERPEPRR